MVKTFTKARIILIAGLLSLFAGCSQNPEIIFRRAYDIVYDSNGGSGKMASDYAIAGENVTLKENEFTKLGKTFIGWLEVPFQEYDEHGAAKYTMYLPGQTISVDSNITFYAQWKENVTRTIVTKNAQTIPLKSIYKDDPDSITLYFQTIIDEEGNERVVDDIPFISMEDVSEFLEPYLYYGDIPEVENYGSFYSCIRNGQYINFYFDTNQICMTDIDTFNMHPSAMAGLDVLCSSYQHSGEKFFFNRLEDKSYYVSAEPKLINLDNYDIHLLTDSNGNGYVPLQTFTDLAWSSLTCMYNGTAVYLMYNYSKLKDDFYENVRDKQPSWDLVEFNFNETCLVLDCYYGLKDEHGIKDFRSYISSLNMKDGTSMLVSYLYDGDPLKPAQALNNLIDTYFDDLHSYYIMPNPYYSAYSFYDRYVKATKNSIYGISSAADDLARSKIKNLRKNSYKSMDGESLSVNVPMYEDKEYDDGIVIILTFDSFDLDLITGYYNLEEEERYEVLEDSVNTGNADLLELVEYTQYKIKKYIEAGKKVKAVVIDDTCNGGGVVDSAIYIDAWIKSGTERYILTDTLNNKQGVCGYEIDTNFDGKFDSSDSLLGLSPDTKIYCLTSGLSFSCGNYMPCSIKGSPNVTLIGQRTGGGACVVLKRSSAMGDLYQISSPKKLNTIKNGSKYSVDTGVEPDVYVSDFRNLYDRTKLVDIINNLK